MQFLVDFAGVHPSVWIGTALLCVLYVAVGRAMGRKPTRAQAFWFGAAVLLLLFTYGELTDLSSQRIFAMRMLQDLLQTLILPPMLLLGLPGWMLRPAMVNRWVSPVAKLLTNPVVAFLVFSGVFVTAHFPPVFDHACRNENFQIFVNLCLMASGLLMWWPIVSPLPEMPRLSYPMRILYIFLLMIPMTAVAAPITMATGVVYPWYLEGAHGWGLKPMEDQILGGLIVWIGQGIYLISVFTAIFFEWSQREDDGESAAPEGRRRQLHAVPPQSRARG
jgi:putative membrane protein